MFRQAAEYLQMALRDIPLLRSNCVAAGVEAE
jgi:hypothetical protein